MKIAGFLLLSLLVPQTFMGLTPFIYNFDDYTNKSVDSQTIVTNSYEIPFEKEQWLFDVQWPVDDYEQTSSLFGSRHVKDCPRCSTYHEGIDFVPGEGSRVYSIMDGKILDIGWDGTYGYRVIIRHVIHPEELEYTTVYAHLQDTNIGKNFYEGYPIKKGDLIGLVGSTGLSTGPHLHFEVHRNETVLDPMEFFNKHIVD